MIKYKGLKLLGFEVLALISKGYKETIEDIEKQLDDNNLVNYLQLKYKDEFAINLLSDIYDINELNQAFGDFSGYIQGNESRKYGIENDDEGLLIVLALILEQLELPQK